MNFTNIMNSSQYDFLRTHPRLGNKIILLGLGGSYAYGTNNENSDIDFRGITLNNTSDLLGLTSFEQYEDVNTDTVIYSFNKIVKLLLECNPNTCEILGLDEDQYLIKTVLGQELINHTHLFLSKRASKSFGGYASAQLRRLQNAVVREYDKIGKRNKKKDDNHLNKHAMHLIRLFMMAIDILDHGVIQTHRVKDLDLLLKIRNGAFQNEDHTFSSEFYDILAYYEKELERATNETSLPENPDMEKVSTFVEYVNRKVINGDY